MLALVRLIGAFAALIFLPLTAGALSTEQFGLWTAILSLSSLLSIASLGLAPALVTEISRISPSSYRHRDEGIAISTAFYLSAASSTIVFVAGSMLIIRSDWTQVFRLVIVSESEARSALWLSLLLVLLSLPFSQIMAIRQGQRLNAQLSLLQFLVSTIMVASALLFAKAGLWIGVVCSQFAATLVVSVIGWSLGGPSRKVRHPTIGMVRRATAKRLLWRGSHYTILQVAAVAAFSSDNLIAARMFGANSVGGYAFPARLIASLVALASTAASPMWAGVGEATSRSANIEVLIVVARVRRLLLPGAIFTGAIAFLVLPSLASALSAGKYVPSTALTFWLSTFLAASLVGVGIAPILDGLSLTGFQARCSALMAGFNLLISVCVAIAFGIIGFAVGSAVSYSLTITIPYYIKLNRIHKELSIDTKEAPQLAFQKD